jgi:hypothetical protein
MRRVTGPRSPSAHSVPLTALRSSSAHSVPLTALRSSSAPSVTLTDLRSPPPRSVPPLPSWSTRHASWSRGPPVGGPSALCEEEEQEIAMSEQPMVNLGGGGWRGGHAGHGAEERMREGARLRRRLGEQLSQAALTLASGGAVGEVECEVARVLRALALVEGPQGKRTLPTAAEQHGEAGKEKSGEPRRGSGVRNGTHSDCGHALSPRAQLGWLDCPDPPLIPAPVATC